MSGIMMMMMGALSYPVITYTAWDVHYAAGIALNAGASLQFNTDGTITRTGTGSFVGVDGVQWATTDASVGGRTWIKATLVAGAVPGTGALNTVLALSSARTWALAAATTDATSTITFDFYADAGGTILLKSVTSTFLTREHV